jgi:hypothetical protein
LSLVEVEKNRSTGILSLSVDADVGQDGVEKFNYDQILARQVAPPGAELNREALKSDGGTKVREIDQMRILS